MQGYKSEDCEQDFFFEFLEVLFVVDAHLLSLFQILDLLPNDSPHEFEFVGLVSRAVDFHALEHLPEEHEVDAEEAVATEEFNHPHVEARVLQFNFDVDALGDEPAQSFLVATRDKCEERFEGLVELEEVVVDGGGGVVLAPVEPEFQGLVDFLLREGFLEEEVVGEEGHEVVEGPGVVPCEFPGLPSCQHVGLLLGTIGLKSVFQELSVGLERQQCLQFAPGVGDDRCGREGDVGDFVGECIGGQKGDVVDVLPPALRNQSEDVLDQLLSEAGLEFLGVGQSWEPREHDQEVEVVFGGEQPSAAVADQMVVPQQVEHRRQRRLGQLPVLQEFLPDLSELCLVLHVDPQRPDHDQQQFQGGGVCEQLTRVAGLSCDCQDELFVEDVFHFVPRVVVFADGFACAEGFFAGDEESAEFSVVSLTAGEEVVDFFFVAETVVEPDFGPEASVLEGVPALGLGEVVPCYIPVQFLALESLLELLLQEFEGDGEEAGEVGVSGGVGEVGLELVGQHVPRVRLVLMAKGEEDFPGHFCPGLLLPHGPLHGLQVEVVELGVVLPLPEGVGLLELEGQVLLEELQPARTGHGLLAAADETVLAFLVEVLLDGGGGEVDVEVVLFRGGALGGGFSLLGCPLLQGLEVNSLLEQPLPPLLQGHHRPQPWRTVPTRHQSQQGLPAQGVVLWLRRDRLQELQVHRRLLVRRAILHLITIYKPSTNSSHPIHYTHSFYLLKTIPFYLIPSITPIHSISSHPFHLIKEKSPLNRTTLGRYGVWRIELMEEVEKEEKIQKGRDRNMQNKIVNNFYENIFQLTTEPIYVAPEAPPEDTPTDTPVLDPKKKKNTHVTLFSALNHAENNSVIKMETGLYNENNEVRTEGIRIQNSDPGSNPVLVSEEFPTLVIELPSREDKVSMEGLRFAHLCRPGKGSLRWPGMRVVKDNRYRPLKVDETLNTSILVRRGILQVDECRFSLAAQKDHRHLYASIVVEDGGTLVITRSQLVGGVGTVGIYCLGGKCNVRECIFKDHQGVGMWVNGGPETSLILKNSLLTHCNDALVLNGPFTSSVQNNNIHDCTAAGVIALFGNTSNIINNEVHDCRYGIEVQNANAKVMKNNIVGNKEYGLCSWSRQNGECSPMFRFNLVAENKRGGIMVWGAKNRSEVSNNLVRHNQRVGVRVESNAHPHIFLNEVKGSFGSGVVICNGGTSFLEKNHIVGSLNCNLVLEGPRNIDNYIYNNHIEDARGQGVFLLHCEKFLIAKNTITNNYNGMVALTSVVNFEDNTVTGNKCNGVMLIDDCMVLMSSNLLKNNRKAGLVVRNTSSAKMKKNQLEGNKIEMLVENYWEGLNDLEEDNTFDDNVDIRVPGQLSCQLI